MSSLATGTVSVSWLAVGPANPFQRELLEPFAVARDFICVPCQQHSCDTSLCHIVVAHLCAPLSWGPETGDSQLVAELQLLWPPHASWAVSFLAACAGQVGSFNYLKEVRTSSCRMRPGTCHQAGRQARAEQMLHGHVPRCPSTCKHRCKQEHFCHTVFLSQFV